MFTFLIIIELIVSILLILLYSCNQQGCGLAGTFGGVQSVSCLCTPDGDFSRVRPDSCCVIFVLALVINIFFLPRGASGESVLQRERHAAFVPSTPQLPPQQARCSVEID